MVRRRFRGPLVSKLGVNKKMSNVNVKLRYWRAGYFYIWLTCRVAALQLQECNQKAEDPGGPWASSCSLLRPKAQLPLTSVAIKG